MTVSSKTPEESRRAEFIAARNIYITIIVSFVTICAVAVIVTTRMEAAKTGFRPIETEKPMSFIDKTYMYKDNTSSSDKQNTESPKN